ncbi:MAG: hypothetical protein ACI4Q3_10795 [Kiritimatiellia bacterium]
METGALSVLVCCCAAVCRGAEVARSPMDWTPVHTQAIAQWKAEHRAAAGVVVDKAARTVRVLMEATGLAAAEPAEFFAIGPLSDRAYESVFVTVASPADVAQAMAAVGIPRGIASDPAQARFWPQGEKVRVTARAVSSGRNLDFSDLLEDVRAEAEGPVLDAPVVYTGGLRDASGVPVAATNIPCAVFALYTSGPSLFQLDGRFDQSTVYGRFRPKAAFPKGELYELALTWDGRTRVRDREVKLTADNAAEVLAQLKQEAAAGDVYARVALDPSVTVGRAADIARAFSVLDGQGVKMNGAAEGQFFYRAFLPEESWRNRAGRMFQPFEIHVAADGSKSFTFIEEDWSGDGLDPVLKPKTTPIGQWTDILPLIARTGEQGAKVVVMFVYAPKTMCVADVSPVVKAVFPRINTFYVFGE